jgi:hypothetical protein
MELLKCGQCGDRPGLLIAVVDRAAGTNINLCYECYKNYVKRIKDGKADRVSVVCEEGVSER